MSEFTPLSITTDASADAWRVVAAGELDIAGVPGLEAAIAAAHDAGARQIVLDLSQVTFVDSSGIRVLVDAAARDHGDGRLTIVSSPAVDRVIELSGLREHLPLA